jgi:hypothetical protein
MVKLRAKKTFSAGNAIMLLMASNANKKQARVRTHPAAPPAMPAPAPAKRFFPQSHPPPEREISRRFLILFLVAGARRLAVGLMDGPVVHADDGLGAVAPEIARHGPPVILVREGFLLRGTGEHGFGPQMLAKFRVHGIRLSV